MIQRVNELLGNLPAIHKAQTLSALQQRLDAVLPERFRGAAQVVALENGELRVLCTNGAIASRLRLESGRLAEAMQQRGLAVRSVSLKVQPANTRKSQPVRKKAELPNAARKAFAEAAERMEDGEVKDALQRLLRHHQGTQ